jgi:hypothetical protein
MLLLLLLLLLPLMAAWMDGCDNSSLAGHNRSGP